MSDYGQNDWYVDRMQRLEADVKYWQGAYINNSAKLLDLQAQIDRLKADKARMDEWLEQCQYVEGRCATPLHAKVNDDGEVTAVYADYRTDLTAVLGREQVKNIQGQVLDSRGEDNA